MVSQTRSRKAEEEGERERERERRMVKFSVGGKRRKTLPRQCPSLSSCSSSSASHGYEEEGVNVDVDFVGGDMVGSSSHDSSKESITVRIDPDVLDCSICCEPLAPPVFQCKNGHIACSSCCPKLKNKCHSCSCPIGSSRCLAIEKVIESIKISCLHANNGCRETFSYSQRCAHEETCIYSPCACPICDCTFKGCMQQFPHHFSSKHGVSATRFVYNSFFKVSIDENKPFDVLRGEDGVLFLLLNNTDMAIGVGNAIMVTCFRPSTQKVDFTYELVVKTEGSSLRLEAAMVNIKRSKGVCPYKDFLLVPRDFCGVLGKLNLEICIRNTLPSPTSA